ncbi:MAG: 50S ribosomal protein L21 [Clostridiales bacterium]|nr:50S ribosomal protein L21 [Clostridiales bacterium]
MYAVVSTGGKQLKVVKGAEAVVEKLDAAVGETVTFDVLFVADGDAIVADRDALASALVTAEVVEHFRGDKQIVFKFKKRKGYKRLKGHRQDQTRVVITDVALAGGTKAVPKQPAKAAPKKAVVAETSAEQCEAVKSSGERCGNKPKDGSRYCGVHAKKYDA